MIEQADHYGYRLAAVNTHNPVIASEDIFNHQGALLLAKGSQFSQARAQLIAQHKLVKPLEHSVDIANSLDAKALFSALAKFSKSMPGLQSTMEDEDFLACLQAHCAYYEKFPLLRQKLTVLCNQLPEIYHNSLYSALAGLMIAEEMSLSAEEKKAVFIGGLMHNSGFLHLNPELTCNEAELERDESLEVQVHPIIAKHFLDQVPTLPKLMGEVVADHHERTDGTGYPKNKFGEDLSIACQIIAFTDTVVRAHKACQHHGDHAHQLMMIIVQFNNSVHFEKVYKAAANIMKVGPRPSTPPLNVPSARALRAQQQRIAETFDACKKLGFVLMKSTKFRITKSIASMLGRLATSIISAGLTQIEYENWLDEVIETKDPAEDLALLKSQVMQDEIEDQLEHFKTIMWKTIKKIPKEDDMLLQSVIQTYNQIERLRATT